MKRRGKMGSYERREGEGREQSQSANASSRANAKGRVEEITQQLWQKLWDSFTDRERREEVGEDRDNRETKRGVRGL
jgi:hypothetical protein